MDIYDNLHGVISRAIWDAFKPGPEPPDANALEKAVRGQLQLYLHTSMYPQYEELIGVIDEDAFTESLVKEFWEKRAVKQTDGNYLFSSEGNEPWLDDAERNGEITWHYWEQYRKYLDEDKGTRNWKCPIRKNCELSRVIVPRSRCWIQLSCGPRFNNQ